MNSLFSSCFFCFFFFSNSLSSSNYSFEHIINNSNNNITDMINSLYDLSFLSRNSFRMNNSNSSFNYVMDSTERNMDYIEYVKTTLVMVINYIAKYLEPKFQGTALNCSQALISLLDEEDLLNASKLFSYSGKTLSETGFEKECNASNGSDGNIYFKIVYSMNFSSKVMRAEDNEVMNLLNQTGFYTDICFLSQCFPFIKAFYESPNVAISHFFEENNMYNRSIIWVDDKDKEKFKQYVSFTLFEIFFWFTIGYFCFKILMTIIKIVFFSGYDSQYVLDLQVIKQELETIGKLCDSDSQETNLKKIDSNPNPNTNSNSNSNSNPQTDNNSNSQNTKKSEEEYDFSNIFKKEQFEHKIVQKKPLVYLIFKFFDIFDNVSILLNPRHLYYNDSRINIFSFIRFVIMFFITFYHNFYTLIQIPGKDFVNTTFYETFLFAIVKLSSYSSILWFIIEAATFSFKFMSSIKRELLQTQQQSISFIFVLKWWCRTIPKIILFYLAFLIFHTFLDYFKYFFDTSTMFEYYLQKIDTMKCKSEYQTFIPFYFSYMDSSRHFAHCYKFVYYSINQFYCFIIITLIVYISLRIKSQLIDYGLLILWFINIILIFLFKNDLSLDHNDNKYIMIHILGQNTTEKLTHLALNYYLIGVWLGFCYFYYYDAISHQSQCQSNQYVPFRFCYHITVFFDTMKKWVKVIVLVILTAISVLLSLSFTIMLYIKRGLEIKEQCEKEKIEKENVQNQLSFCFDQVMNIIDYYDKIIISLCFSFIVLFLLVLPDDSAVKHLIISKLFIPFSRINTAFFYLIEIIIYGVYSFFILQLSLSYSNLIIISFGLLFIVIIICFLVTIMFELPIRILIKFLLRKRISLGSFIKGEEIEMEVNQSFRLMEGYE